jgi:WD40 repeat protein
MGFLFGPTIRDEICLLVRTASAGGTLQVWDTLDFSGTKLAEFTLSSPAFSAPSSGTITAVAISPTTVLASGDAVAWRIMSSASVLVLKGTVGGPDSGADWELQTEDAQLLQNQDLAILSFTYTAPL